jgi:hypothetical protein
MSPIPQQIQKAVQARSLASVARDLGVNYHTLASYLAGAARPGSVLLIEVSWQKLKASTPREARP